MASLQAPKNYKGTMQKLKKLGGIAGVAFVGVDAYSRIKEGESAPVAVGKALLTNALWGLAPGGVVGAGAAMIGVTVAEMAPAIGYALEMKKAELGQKKSQFGGNFQSTQAQQMLLEHGINRITNARAQLARNMAGHARQAQRVY